MCQEFVDLAFPGAFKDAIPSLTNPAMVTPESIFAEYLKPTDRVIGFEGPLAGESLGSIPDAYVAFWFAFVDLFPDVILWSPDAV